MLEEGLREMMEVTSRFFQYITQKMKKKTIGGVTIRSRD